MTILTAWYLDVGAWAPTGDEWDELLGYLLPEDKERILRFRFDKDRKFALCSRLLQFRLVHESFHTPYWTINLARTQHGKPFWPDCPNPHWNYNVSHQGAVVAIAAADNVRIGIDVVCVTEKPVKQPLDRFFANFELCFGAREWRQIHAADDALVCFYQLWSLKEAYVKALGLGVGFDLLRAQFEVRHGLIQLYVDDQPSMTWQFHTTQLDAAHWASIAIEVPRPAALPVVAWRELRIKDLVR
ncbi:L-aminoadipate-semialdehyde dehydrogenase-phosphopantetheinyl transferase [Achlya hypogyna]|uniref:holo-[acyl-carrier-protein] synthase n=1 Tax=Achlya hypogyna TaxID=1202772 RepID=A0A1V9ZHW0_ACHHY|nr:L-aminoadipate-semialdehyde dehydrogenase-phosphopantetheinyl transferase [Achlya hypogyna]